MPATAPESSRRAAALLILAIFVVAVLDATTGPELHISSFMGIAPLVRRAALLATATPASSRPSIVVCLTYVDILTVPDWAPASRVVGIFGAILVAVFSLVLCRTRLQREALYARTRLVADTVQRAMLRELPLNAGPVEAYGFYVSAQEGARVGGDIYEAIDTPHGHAADDRRCAGQGHAGDRRRAWRCWPPSGRPPSTRTRWTRWPTAWSRRWPATTPVPSSRAPTSASSRRC